MGIPLDNGTGVDVYAVLPDGGLGFRPFTRELTDHPVGDEDDVAPVPHLLSHREPLPGIQMAEETGMARTGRRTAPLASMTM